MAPQTPPPTMLAWKRSHRGPPSSTLVLKTTPTPPLPSTSSSDILIRTSHVSLQHNTGLLMSLIPRLPFLNSDPYIPELEFSGITIAAGSNAPSELQPPGTSVTGFVNPLGAVLLGRGVLAEYILVPGSNCARVDDSRIAGGMAAASGINGCGSAARKMVRVAGVKAGQRVLVNGASGSVGGLVVQLLKLRGAHIVGVASGGNEGVVRGLVVDEFIDYKSQPLPTYLIEHNNTPQTQFDHILDCVGTQSLFTHSPSYLRPTGTYINIGMIEGMFKTSFNWISNTFLPTWLGGVPRRYIMFSTPPTRDDAVFIGRLVEEGVVRVLVDGVWGMGDVKSAYERVLTGRARGKVVVRVWDGGEEVA